MGRRRLENGNGNGNLLEALAEEFRPVAEAAVHDSCMNQVEVVGGPGPRLFGVVDFELWGRTLVMG